LCLILADIVEALIAIYVGTHEWLKRFGWPIAVLGTLVLPTTAVIGIIVGLFWTL